MDKNDELEQYRQIRAGIITQKIAFERLLNHEQTKLQMVEEKIRRLKNA